MSVNAIEKALWQALSSPSDLALYRKDAKQYLQSFALDDDERHVMLTWDVNAAIARGVNPLLLMMAFSTVNGRQRRAEYMAKVNKTWREDGPSKP